jgi:hypothetical protein
MRRAAGAALALVIAGCGGGTGAPGPSPQAAAAAGEKAPGFPASLEGLQGTRPQAGAQPQQAAAADGGYSIDAGNREQVRLFYNSVFASSAGVASGWSGNVAACNAGTTSAEYKSAILRRINWFRALAGVPASVQFDASFSAQAQQAALMMAANQQLSHSPPSNWLCYTSAGGQAAGKSDLTIGRSGPDAIGESYMRDEGANNAEAGHRRWLLYPQTQFMGTGDVDGSLPVNALWVQDANVFGARPAVRDDFVAWPTKGYTPYTLVYARWSFSYPGADFSTASVTMSENGVSIATRKETAVNGYGEPTLVWFPGSYVDGMSWARPAADTVYQVTISNVKVAGVTRNFTYTATVFDPQVGTAPPPTLTGASSLATGQAGSYAFDPVAGATAYQWRTLAVSPQSFADGAETGAGNFQPTISAGYPVVASDLQSSGENAFHLTHMTPPVDQVMVLNQTFVATASSMLRFDSRLGLSSAGQVALIEASVDDGATWTPLYQQAGQQSGTTSSLGETSFTPKAVPLGTFANRALRLRWRYEILPAMSYYPGPNSGVGWYFDNIQLTGVLAVTAAGAPVDIAGTAFQSGFGAGTFALQARAGMYGYFGEWGYAKSVTVTATLPQSDCLFAWAQTNYGTLFAPPAPSQVLDVYYYRHYTGTRAYLGISSANDHVYYLPEGGNLQDAGSKSAWFATAGCQ